MTGQLRYVKFPKAGSGGTGIELRRKLGWRGLIAALGISVAFGVSVRFAVAEEAAGGHYLPGATASFIDMLPDRDTFTFVYVNAFTYYEGTASKELDFGGLLTADTKGTVYADTSLFLEQTPWKLFGGAYGAAILVPYYWLDIKGDVLFSGKRRSIGASTNDAANGFGDIQLLPLMFGWKFGDLKLQTQFGIYGPTAGFDKGDLVSCPANNFT
jgi:hypothetical protein